MVCAAQGETPYNPYSLAIDRTLRARPMTSCAMHNRLRLVDWGCSPKAPKDEKYLAMNEKILRNRR